jgi:hypothetical protein
MASEMRWLEKKKFIISGYYSYNAVGDYLACVSMDGILLHILNLESDGDISPGGKIELRDGIIKDCVERVR